MLRTHNRLASSGTSKRAFTLIELLIVIGIIGLLVAITLVVGGQVASGGKDRLTRDTLRVLDTALAEFVNARDGIPEATVVDPRNNTYLIPVADARDMEHDDQSAQMLVKGNQMINSVGLFILQVQDVPKAKAAIDSLPTRVIRRLDADDPTAADSQPDLLTAMDAWGRPIRYVHPVFDGLVLQSPGDMTSAKDVDSIIGTTTGMQYRIARVRRNNQGAANATAAQALPDSDGGVCTGNRPYFYSAGPDGLVGTDPATGANYNADNIYSTAPGFQKD